MRSLKPTEAATGTTQEAARLIGSLALEESLLVPFRRIRVRYHLRRDDGTAACTFVGYPASQHDQRARADEGDRHPPRGRPRQGQRPGLALALAGRRGDNRQHGSGARGEASRRDSPGGPQRRAGCRRLTRARADQIRVIGPGRPTSPAPDMGTSAQTMKMAWIVDAVLRSSAAARRGGGARQAARARAALGRGRGDRPGPAPRPVLLRSSPLFETSTTIDPVSGNVRFWAAQLWPTRGAKVVAVSDQYGGRQEPAGDSAVTALLEHRNKTGVKGFSEVGDAISARGAALRGVRRDDSRGTGWGAFPGIMRAKCASPSTS